MNVEFDKINEIISSTSFRGNIYPLHETVTEAKSCPLDESVEIAEISSEIDLHNFLDFTDCNSHLYSSKVCNKNPSKQCKKVCFVQQIWL